jgi:hypothetical protein
MRPGYGDDIMETGPVMEVIQVRVPNRGFVWLRQSWATLNQTALRTGWHIASITDGRCLAQEPPLMCGATHVCGALCRRLVLPESGATVSRGVAFFCLDSSGHITRILDSPEHPMKLSARGLTVFGPLVQGLAGPMLPVVQDLGR